MDVLAIVGALVLALLFVLILGVMREVVIMRGEVTALAQLITDPPPPSYLGQRLPDALARWFTSPSDQDGLSRGAWVLAFVSPGCGTCTSLLREVAEAVSEGTLISGDIRFVVTWTDEPEPELYRRAAAVSDAILDTDGTLARACELRVTPTLLAVDADSLKTVGYKPGGDLSWVYNALDVPAPLTAKSNLQVVSP